MIELPENLLHLVPIFPLPGCVLFPYQVLPLHIFEPRYRTMAADVLAGERILAIALLKRNYEESYFTLHAPIHPQVGIGQIIGHEPLDDGKCNILLRGVARAEIVSESTDKPYRCAQLKQLSTRCACAAEHQVKLLQRLREAVCEHATLDQSRRCQEALELLNGEHPFETIIDKLCGVLPTNGETRQRLFAELDLTHRAELLADQIETLAAKRRQGKHVPPCDKWMFN